MNLKPKVIVGYRPIEQGYLRPPSRLVNSSNRMVGCACEVSDVLGNALSKGKGCIGTFGNRNRHRPSSNYLNTLISNELTVSDRTIFQRRPRTY